jgi:hypothetical protein
MPGLIFADEDADQKSQSMPLPVSAMKSEFTAPPSSVYLDALRNPLINNTPHTRRSANDHQLWEKAKYARRPIINYHLLYP